MSEDIFELASRLLEVCREKGIQVVTAESCTGGLVAGALTEVPGSSDVVERGFVTYSNEAKSEMLGVPADLIKAHGAVSELVARAMAEGALGHSRASLAVAVTGVAGPGGGSAAKPVGLVHFAAEAKWGARLHVERHFGELSRAEIRRLAVIEALALLTRLAGERSFTA